MKYSKEFHAFTGTKSDEEVDSILGGVQGVLKSMGAKDESELESVIGGKVYTQQAPAAPPAPKIPEQKGFFARLAEPWQNEDDRQAAIAERQGEKSYQAWEKQFRGWQARKALAKSRNQPFTEPQPKRSVPSTAEGEVKDAMFSGVRIATGLVDALAETGGKYNPINTIRGTLAKKEAWDRADATADGRIDRSEKARLLSKEMRRKQSLDALRSTEEGAGFIESVKAIPKAIIEDPYSMAEDVVAPGQILLGAGVGAIARGAGSAIGAGKVVANTTRAQRAASALKTAGVGAGELLTDATLGTAAGGDEVTASNVAAQIPAALAIQGASKITQAIPGKAIDLYKNAKAAKTKAPATTTTPTAAPTTTPSAIPEPPPIGTLVKTKTETTNAKSVANSVADISRGHLDSNIEANRIETESALAEGRDPYPIPVDVDALTTSIADDAKARYDALPDINKGDKTKAGIVDEYASEVKAKYPDPADHGPIIDKIQDALDDTESVAVRGPDGKVYGQRQKRRVNSDKKTDGQTVKSEDRVAREKYMAILAEKGLDGKSYTDAKAAIDAVTPFSEQNSRYLRNQENAISQHQSRVARDAQKKFTTQKMQKENELNDKLADIIRNSEEPDADHAALINEAKAAYEAYRADGTGRDKNKALGRAINVIRDNGTEKYSGSKLTTAREQAKNQAREKIKQQYGDSFTDENVTEFFHKNDGPDDVLEPDHGIRDSEWEGAADALRKEARKTVRANENAADAKVRNDLNDAKSAWARARKSLKESGASEEDWRAEIDNAKKNGVTYADEDYRDYRLKSEDNANKRAATEEQRKNDAAQKEVDAQIETEEALRGRVDGGVRIGGTHAKHKTRKNKLSGDVVAKIVDDYSRKIKNVNWRDALKEDFPDLEESKRHPGTFSDAISGEDLRANRVDANKNMNKETLESALNGLNQMKTPYEFTRKLVDMAKDGMFQIAESGDLLKSRINSFFDTKAIKEIVINGHQGTDAGDAIAAEKFRTLKEVMDNRATIEQLMAEKPAKAPEPTPAPTPAPIATEPATAPPRAPRRPRTKASENAAAAKAASPKAKTGKAKEAAKEAAKGVKKKPSDTTLQSPMSVGTAALLGTIAATQPTNFGRAIFGSAAIGTLLYGMSKPHAVQLMRNIRKIMSKFSAATMNRMRDGLIHATRAFAEFKGIRTAQSSLAGIMSRTREFNMPRHQEIADELNRRLRRIRGAFARLDAKRRGELGDIAADFRNGIAEVVKSLGPMRKVIGGSIEQDFYIHDALNGRLDLVPDEFKPYASSAAEKIRGIFDTIYRESEKLGDGLKTYMENWAPHRYNKDAVNALKNEIDRLGWMKGDFSQMPDASSLAGKALINTRREFGKFLGWDGDKYVPLDGTPPAISEIIELVNEGKLSIDDAPEALITYKIPVMLDGTKEAIIKAGERHDPHQDNQRRLPYLGKEFYDKDIFSVYEDYIVNATASNVRKRLLPHESLRDAVLELSKPDENGKYLFDNLTKTQAKLGIKDGQPDGGIFKLLSQWANNKIPMEQYRILSALSNTAGQTVLRQNPKSIASALVDYGLNTVARNPKSALIGAKDFAKDRINRATFREKWSPKYQEQLKREKELGIRDEGRPMELRNRWSQVASKASGFDAATRATDRNAMEQGLKELKRRLDDGDNIPFYYNDAEAQYLRDHWDSNDDYVDELKYGYMADVKAATSGMADAGNTPTMFHNPFMKATVGWMKNVPAVQSGIRNENLMLGKEGGLNQRRAIQSSANMIRSIGSGMWRGAGISARSAVMLKAAALMGYGPLAAVGGLGILTRAYDDEKDNVLDHTNEKADLTSNMKIEGIIGDLKREPLATLGKTMVRGATPVGADMLYSTMDDGMSPAEAEISGTKPFNNNPGSIALAATGSLSVPLKFGYDLTDRGLGYALAKNIPAINAVSPTIVEEMKAKSMKSKAEAALAKAASHKELTPSERAALIEYGEYNRRMKGMAKAGAAAAGQGEFAPPGGMMNFFK